MTTISIKRILLIATLFIIACLNNSCNETISTEFATYQALEESNYLQKGWIPRVLPRDAINIKEMHNIDNNRTYGCFEFDNTTLIDTLLELYPIASLQNVIKSIETIYLPNRPNWFITNNDLKDVKPLLIKYEDVIVHIDTTRTYLIIDTINMKGYFVH